MTGAVCVGTGTPFISEAKILDHMPINKGDFIGIQFIKCKKLPSVKTACIKFITIAKDNANIGETKVFKSFGFQNASYLYFVQAFIAISDSGELMFIL